MSTFTEYASLVFYGLMIATIIALLAGYVPATPLTLLTTAILTIAMGLNIWTSRRVRRRDGGDGS